MAVRIAATGASRQAVAARLGFTVPYLRTWIDKGQANPDSEPEGSFSRAYLEAERALEITGLAAAAEQLVYIAKKKPEQRTLAEIEAVIKWVARLYPREHGAG